MATYLEEADYDLVRKALSNSFTSVTLPDDQISSPLIADAANAYITKRLEDVTVAEDDTAALGHAKNATAYYAAYLLVPTVIGQLSAAMTHRGATGLVQTPNWRQLADELLNRVEIELGYVSTDDDDDRPGLANTSSHATVQVGF